VWHENLTKRWTQWNHKAILFGSSNSTNNWQCVWWGYYNKGI